jgi:hypothetical protein
MLIQKQKWFLDKASSSWPVLYCRPPISLLVFTQAFVDGCRKDEQEIKDGGDVVEFVSLQAFVKLIDAVGKFCNFDKEFGVPLKLGIALGSKCDSLTKVGQAAEHFMLHMRNHFLVEASDQRKAGGSKLVLLVSLLNRMKRDHKQAKTKTKFVEWFKDKTLMQQGLANHSLVLSTDGKAVYNEAIEELLLASGVTTADIWSCTIDWSKTCAFETVRWHKPPLSYYIEQAGVGAAFRLTPKRPELQRQLSTTSSDPDSAFGSASSAADPAFGAPSDIENGSTWGTPSEKAAFAARLEMAKEASLSPGSRSIGPAPFGASGDCASTRRDARSSEGESYAVSPFVDQCQPGQAESSVPGDEHGERSVGGGHRVPARPAGRRPSSFHANARC